MCVVVSQGYILGQYGLLYALQHPDKVSRLMLLNTPVATNTKLRPELAAYKNPVAFLRPKKDVRGIIGWSEVAAAMLGFLLVAERAAGSKANI